MGVPASFFALLVISLSRVVMCASVGLRIEGRSAEEYVSGQTSGGPGVPTAVVVEVLPVGYLLSPSKGKEKIREIRYPRRLRLFEGRHEVRGGRGP